MDPEDQARYSADLPTLGAAGPPGNPPVERVRDVLILTGDPNVDQGDASDLIMLPSWEGGNRSSSGSWSGSHREMPDGNRDQKASFERLPISRRWPARGAEGALVRSAYV